MTVLPDELAVTATFMCDPGLPLGRGSPNKCWLSENAPFKAASNALVSDLDLYLSRIHPSTGMERLVWWDNALLHILSRWWGHSSIVQFWVVSPRAMRPPVLQACISIWSDSRNRLIVWACEPRSTHPLPTTISKKHWIGNFPFISFSIRRRISSWLMLRIPPLKKRISK